MATAVVTMSAADSAGATQGGRGVPEGPGGPRASCPSPDPALRSVARLAAVGEGAVTRASWTLPHRASRHAPGLSAGWARSAESGAPTAPFPTQVAQVREEASGQGPGRDEHGQGTEKKRRNGRRIWGAGVAKGACPPLASSGAAARAPPGAATLSPARAWPSSGLSA